MLSAFEELSPSSDGGYETYGNNHIWVQHAGKVALRAANGTEIELKTTDPITAFLDGALLWEVGRGTPDKLRFVGPSSDVRWIISEGVTERYTTIGGHLFVTNPSKRVIEVDPATGNERRTVPLAPTSLSSGWLTGAAGRTIHAIPR